jgi:hypothetical protein
VAHAHAQNERLQSLLLESEEDHAIAILRRFRSGESIRSILHSPHVTNKLNASHERMIRQELLHTIFKSTAPLDQIVAFSKKLVTAGPRMYVPALSVLKPLQDCIITLETLTSIFDADAAVVDDGRAESATTDDAGTAEQRSPLLPKYSLRASPWTHVSISDAAFSHLISLFLAFVNPYWRFVEKDEFLAALQLGDTTSEFCSKTLVHAMLSCASASHVQRQPPNVTDESSSCTPKSTKLSISLGTCYLEGSIIKRLPCSCCKREVRV